jgi:hypothetical protein
MLVICLSFTPFRVPFCSVVFIFFLFFLFYSDCHVLLGVVIAIEEQSIRIALPFPPPPLPLCLSRSDPRHIIAVIACLTLHDGYVCLSLLLHCLTIPITPPCAQLQPPTRQPHRLSILIFPPSFCIHCVLDLFWIKCSSNLLLPRRLAGPAHRGSSKTRF